MSDEERASREQIADELLGRHAEEPAPLLDERWYGAVVAALVLFLVCVAFAGQMMAGGGQP